jgi:hypothetical protein
VEFHEVIEKRRSICVFKEAKKVVTDSRPDASGTVVVAIVSEGWPW